MTAIKKLASSSGTVVSGTLSGSGNLTIPVGVTEVSLTGRGATGWNNYVYNPGQQAIAPSGWVTYVPATQNTWHWQNTFAADYNVYSQNTGINVSTGAGDGPFPSGMVDWSGRGYYLYSDSPNYPPSYAGEDIMWVWSNADGAGKYTHHHTSFKGYIDSYGNPESGGYYSNPGQPYIAPSSTGGPQTGTSTTATLNGVTRTWLGGYDAGGVGNTSTQTITSTGVGQNMSYSIGSSGGTLSYQYTL